MSKRLIVSVVGTILFACGLLLLRDKVCSTVFNQWACFSPDSSYNAAIALSDTTMNVFIVLAATIMWVILYAVGGTEVVKIPSFLALSVGSEAEVIESVGLRLLSHPTSMSKELKLMPKGATVLVIGGPVLGDGTWWWRVSYEDVEGWAEEGDGESDPFMQPAEFDV